MDPLGRLSLLGYPLGVGGHSEELYSTVQSFQLAWKCSHLRGAEQAIHMGYHPKNVGACHFSPRS
jgi:hypothetical protein